jgi:hypothetical protein
MKKLSALILGTLDIDSWDSGPRTREVSGNIALLAARAVNIL